MQQGRAGRTVDILLNTSNVDIARAILRGRAGEIEMEAVELEQFLRVVSAMFTSFEDGYVLRQSGMLDDATVAADEAVLAVEQVADAHRRQALAKREGLGELRFNDEPSGRIDVAVAPVGPLQRQQRRRGGHGGRRRRGGRRVTGAEKERQQREGVSGHRGTFFSALQWG